MKELIKNNKIVRFLLLAAVYYTGWLIIYYFLIKPHTNWDYLLNENLAWLSQQFFNIFDVKTHINVESDNVVLLLDAGNYRGIWIGDECNGFKLFSIFSIFILAFPGNLKSKFWYIPTGIVIIHLVNVFRVMGLILINNYYHEYLDFNHLYTFTILVYSIIFVLWYYWAKKYAGNGAKN